MFLLELDYKREESMSICAGMLWSSVSFKRRDEEVIALFTFKVPERRFKRCRGEC
jgi:hypothetical protein